MKKQLFDLTALREGESLSFTVQDTPAFAVRKDGEVYAYANRCPHLGIPLEWQENQFLDSENELIQCSTHGALFLIETGECLSGPCSGDRLNALELVFEDGAAYLAEQS